jgi:calcineurin-like phosphoesterase family protein
MSLKIEIDSDFKKEERNIWFTSDTHYSHGGICRGTTHWRKQDDHGNLSIPLDAVRDFDTIEEMNEAMVENINSNVKEDDILFHMGDWSFGGIENITEFRYQIKCKNIHFIIGNHDHHIESNKEGIRRYFSSVNSYLEVTIKNNINEAKTATMKLILCHYPIVSWNNMRKGSYMLHGHQHLKGEQRFGNGKRLDIGMCGHPEFRPYSLSEITDLLKDLESYELENRANGAKLIR